mmetsp:Transcript_11193/g.41501  ORF Transcript_11193/g.41501 Transcript_11193/m.41501 type:complete len:225 (+) Transcript_11193:210-884(+)
MSFAFLVEFSMDCMRDPSSEVEFSKSALYITTPMLNSARSRRNSLRSGPSISYSSNLICPASAAFSYSSLEYTVATVGRNEITDWNLLNTIWCFCAPSARMVSATIDAVAKVMGILERSTIVPFTLSLFPLPSCARAFSPTMVIVVLGSKPATTLLYFTTVVLMPPHRPLSDETGTTIVVSVTIPGRSPSMRIRGTTNPLLFSMRVCAPFNRDAATIFMAAVIF